MRKVTVFHFCSFKSFCKDLIMKIGHLKYANLKYAAIIVTSAKKVCKPVTFKKTLNYFKRSFFFSVFVTSLNTLKHFPTD